MPALVSRVNEERQVGAIWNARFLAGPLPARLNDKIEKTL